MADRIMLERALYFLKVCGMHPKYPGFYANLKHFGLVIILTFNEILLILEMALNWNGTDTLENGIEVIFGTFQITTKSITTFIFGRNVFLALDKLVDFWPTRKFGPNLEIELTNIYVKVEKAFNCFLMSMGLAVFMFCTKPLFLSERSLPMKSYDLCNTTNNVCYVILYTWQIFHVYLLSLAVIGVDGLFVSFVTHAFCQFKMIKCGLEMLMEKEVSEAVSLKQLGKLVDHHVLILDFVKDINKIFSLALMSQLFSSVFNLCTTMFLVSIDGFPPTGVRFLRYTPMLLMILIQLFIYCLAGAKIVEESTSIADAAFSCPWATNPHYNLRKFLCMVMQRAHRSTHLNVAGLIELNIETFGGIVRKASSLYMAIQQLRSNEMQEY